MRKTIAFLTDDINSEFHMVIKSGVVDFVQENDLNLITYVIGTIQSSLWQENNKNILLKFIDKNKIDGIIVLSTSIGAYIGPVKLEKYLTEHFKDIPIVNMFYEMRNIHSVYINCESGMNELMEHLIVGHGCKRIAFQYCLEEAVSSNIKLNIYKKVLNKYNIEFDPALIAEGHFGENYGMEAVRSLLDDRKILFDAFMAADDECAIGAIKELNYRNIDVPDDVKVTGYDNLSISQESKPKLTVVNQPFFHVAKESARILYDIINGKDVPLKKEFNTSLFIRESCGCNYLSSLKNSMTSALNFIEKKKLPAITEILKEKNGEFEKENITPILQKIFANITNAMEEISSQQIDAVSKPSVMASLRKIIKLYISAENKDDAKTFLNFWKKYISEYINKYYRIEFFYCIITVLEFFDRKNNTLTKDIIQKAKHIVDNDFYYNETAKKTVILRQRFLIQDFNESLFITSRMDQQMELIYKYLPLFGVNTAFISTYEDGNANFEFSRNLLSFVNRKKLAVPKEKYPTSQLIPENIKLEKFKLTIEALFFGKDQIGYLIFDDGEINGEIIEEIRTLIGIAMKNVIFIGRIKYLVQRIDKIAIERTKKLETKNKALSKEIKKLQDFLTDSENYLEERSCDYRITKAIEYISENYNKYLTLPKIADIAFMSDTYFSKLFKKYMGMGVQKYIIKIRMEKACKLLKNPFLTIKEISRMVGFSNSNYFSKAFKRKYSLLPSEYRMSQTSTASRMFDTN